MEIAKMDVQKTTSKTSLLNMMILRAWKERWSSQQWGTNVKSILPRGVSGDVYNLTDCILQQALVGSTANALILDYLKHSLCTQIVSHAAVLKRISKYEFFDRHDCIIALLQFVSKIIEGVTCRNKSEEALLPSAIASMLFWFLQIFEVETHYIEFHGEGNTEKEDLMKLACIVIEKLMGNQFLLSILYVGSQEDAKFTVKASEKYSKIKASLINSNYNFPCAGIEKFLSALTSIDHNLLDMPQWESEDVEHITYCVQPLLAIDVILNPCNETRSYVVVMQTIQQLKKFSKTRLYYEIIRAGFTSLSDVTETTSATDTMWGAFTIFKVPHIIKQLNALNRCGGDQTKPDYIPEVIDAFEMLLEDNLLLDFMNIKCSYNIIEYLLNDWIKHHLVNEMHVKRLLSKRDKVSMLHQRHDTGNQVPSTINYIIRAEVPLSGILKTLSTDFNKVQEAVLGVLCQLLIGNSFDLILSVATVEGRLKLFVSRLIQCNENSKQVPGEVGKAAAIRSTLFDVSFLMLTFIVQTFGSETILSENGDTFFEKWVRECMVEHTKPKNPQNMIKQCDEGIVEELLLNLNKPDAQFKNNITWQDVCMNIPGVMHQVLLAWEKELLTSADVKTILDNIRRRLFSYSVCATSFLCSYLSSVRENEYLKPLNMIQQFLAPLAGEDMSSQENVKERLGLSFQIIRKMQNEVHAAGNLKTRSLSISKSAQSISPLIESFKEAWKTLSRHGWMSVQVAQTFDSILKAGGPDWLAKQLVEEILKCKYTKDMLKTMDVVFAVLHLNIVHTTAALLRYIIPLIVSNREDINEPQALILARLCVYCIVSSLKTVYDNRTNKKRSRSFDDDADMGSSAKVRKISVESLDITNDMMGENQILRTNTGSATNNLKEQTYFLTEPLNSSIHEMFKVFQNFVLRDEISPKVYFVFYLLSLLVELGGELVRPILQMLPHGLVQNLLKILMTDNISTGFICRLYDLGTSSGRQACVGDLCLWRNIKLRKQNTYL